MYICVRLSVMKLIKRLVRYIKSNSICSRSREYQLCVQVCVLTLPSGFAWYDTKLRVMTSHVPGN